MEIIVHDISGFLRTLGVSKMTEKKLKWRMPRTPFHVKSDKDIQKFSNLTKFDGQTETVPIDKEYVRPILRNNLNMREVCAKMIPKVFMIEQKEINYNSPVLLDYFSPNQAACTYICSPR